VGDNEKRSGRDEHHGAEVLLEDHVQVRELGESQIDDVGKKQPVITVGCQRSPKVSPLVFQL